MIHEIKHNTEEIITNGLVWGAQMFDQSCLVPDNRLLNGDTESAEVMDCAACYWDLACTVICPITFIVLGHIGPRYSEIYTVVSS